MDFNDYLTPQEAQKRFKRELADGTLAEGAEIPTDELWAIVRKDTKITVIGDQSDPTPQIIFTTKQAVRDHPDHFKDMRLVPAYKKGE